jgi:hypothetical protein
MSPDGLAWTERSIAGAASLYGVAWTGSRLVAVGAGGLRIESTDGKAWSAESSGTTNDLLGVVWTDGRLLALGRAGTILTSRCDAGATSRLPAAEEPGRSTRVVHRD